MAVNPKQQSLTPSLVRDSLGGSVGDTVQSVEALSQRVTTIKGECESLPGENRVTQYITKAEQAYEGLLKAHQSGDSATYLRLLVEASAYVTCCAQHLNGLVGLLNGNREKVEQLVSDLYTDWSALIEGVPPDAEVEEYRLDQRRTSPQQRVVKQYGTAALQQLYDKYFRTKFCTLNPTIELG